ncbi:MAG: xanthine dehydrogenase family protein molybdopterin-binding subunit [Pseudomonadota bacterium]|nr:xanthine dehydrogenase family protein molybdopterin-binding subunit [Pseudomonadota bacterium]
MSVTGLTRRRFLQVAAGAGGALTLGISLSGCDTPPTSDAEGRFVPNAFLRIGRDGRITLLVARSEMGQGVMTALPMLIAEELEVDLDQVRVEFAPADRAYDNPMMFIQATGGSTSVATSWTPLRQAGASARQMLLAAAARQWDVPADACYAERGVVVHPASGRRALYGELAGAAAAEPIPREVALKSASSFRLIGTSQRRLDAPGKVDGSAIFGIDVRRPDMLIAVLARPPAFGATLARLDSAAAEAMPGVHAVRAITNGVAVIADSYWQARQAAAVLTLEWTPGPNAGLDSERVRRRHQALADERGLRIRSEGDARGRLQATGERLQADYEVPFLAHATMEPMNATAEVRAESCTIWAPTQNQGGTRDVAAAITGLPLAQVQVHTTHLGGGFGRRVATDFIADAVECSQAVGRPVQVIWSREDDMRHDWYRPAMYHRLQAALDGQGQPEAWYHRVVGPSIVAQALPDLAPAALPDWFPRIGKELLNGGLAMVGGIVPDLAGFEGAREVPYAIADLRVEYRMDRETTVPLGFWRSVGHSHTAFAVESFIDELAHRAGEDPVAFRRRLLAAHPRHLQVLERAAAEAGWDAPAPPGRARGVAVHHSFESYVAQVAEVSVAQDGTIRVHRVVCAVDCGQVVNPLTVRAQMSGGIVFGLGAVLKHAITLRDGGVVEGNFDTYPLIRMNEAPTIEVHIIDSDEAPTGVGEPGVPPIAPAVANAVFAATGRRLRRLPLRLQETG